MFLVTHRPSFSPFLAFSCQIEIVFSKIEAKEAMILEKETVLAIKLKEYRQVHALT